MSWVVWKIFFYCFHEEKLFSNSLHLEAQFSSKKILRDDFPGPEKLLTSLTMHVHPKREFNWKVFVYTRPSGARILFLFNNRVASY